MPAFVSSRSHLRLLALLVAIFLGLPTQYARADKVADLTRTLRSSGSEKERISAAVALGRIGNRRSVKPLVWALRKDSSKVVRAVAAAALGHIGDPRALPALRKASDDSARVVRKRAREAAMRIEQRSEERAVATGAPPRQRSFRNDPYAPPPRRSRIAPQVFVRIEGVTDKTRGRISPKQRAWRSRSFRKLLAGEVRKASAVTTNPETARRESLRRFNLDVTIERLERQLRGPWVEIVCEVRLSVSNERGRLLSFLTGGATVQVPRRTFRREFENQLRWEALENAAKGVNQDLVAYLEKELPNVDGSSVSGFKTRSGPQRS